MTPLFRVFLAFVAASVITLAIWLDRADAHDAPSGWTYPLSCCSDHDCREVPDAAVRAGPGGYVIVGTGEVIGYGDRRVKPSPDGRYHWCSHGGRDDSRTICLFVPPMGF